MFGKKEAKKRIFLVDDDASYTYALRLNLEKIGKYEVGEENRPEEALVSARKFQPDLILLDVMMPRVDGGEIAEAFKNDSELKGAGIVFLTGTILKEEVDQSGGQIGGHFFLPKSMDPRELITRIEAFLK